MEIIKNPLSCLETRDGDNNRNDTEIALICRPPHPCGNFCWAVQAYK